MERCGRVEENAVSRFDHAFSRSCLRTTMRLWIEVKYRLKRKRSLPRHILAREGMERTFRRYSPSHQTADRRTHGVDDGDSADRPTPVSAVPNVGNVQQNSIFATSQFLENTPRPLRLPFYAHLSQSRPPWYPCSSRPRKSVEGCRSSDLAWPMRSDSVYELFNLF